MQKKLIFILQVMVIVSLLSGCWSRNEPKNLSMVNSVLYDIKENGDSQLYLEIMHPTAEPGGKGGGEKTSSLILACEGTTVPEAIRDQTKSIEKVLFGGLNKARLFSEKLSQKGILPILDYVSRDHLTDETPLVIVIQDKDPKRIYTCETGLSDMVGNYLDDLSNVQHKSTCQSVEITTLKFMKDYYEDGKQPVMGLAKIVEDKAKSSDSQGGQSGSQGGQSGSQGGQSGSQGGQGSTPKKEYIRYEGLAAFKDDKLVGYMDGPQTRAYNILTNDFSATVVSIPSGNSFTAVSIKKAASKIKTEVSKEKPQINIEIKAAGSIIQEGDSTLDISKNEELKKVEQALNEYLKDEIQKSIQKAQQEFKSDIFGLGCSVHSQHPEDWKKIKNNWDDYFSKATINVTVDSSIMREGEIKRPFGKEE